MANMEDVDIKSRYIVKLGVVLLKLKPDHAQEMIQKYLDREKIDETYYDEMVALQREIKEALSTCSDIKSLQWRSELRKEHFEPFEHHLYGYDTIFVQQSSSFLFFEGFIPKSERRYTFEIRYTPDVIENFGVLYNGQIFLAYSKVNEDRSEMMFGPEVREFLVNSLKSKKWDVITVPPCPLHPHIYVNFVDSNSHLTEQLSPVISEYEINYFFPLQWEAEIRDLFEYLIREHSFDIADFLSLVTLQQKGEELSWQIQDLFDSVVNDFKRVDITKRMTLFRKWADIERIRSSIFDLHILLNDYSNAFFKLQMGRNALAEKDSFQLIENPLQPYFVRYFMGYREGQPIPLGGIKETIQYIEQRIISRYINYYTVLAAVLGALVGIAISNISTLLKIIAP